MRIRLETKNNVEHERQKLLKQVVRYDVI